MSYPNFSFTYTNYDNSPARVGHITTPHGVIETPAFIFCATRAVVKGVPINMVKECGTQIILANTYHLMLQPGADLTAQLGGLHKMTGWHGPMLTDSGGFQIFSLGHGGVSQEIKANRQRSNHNKTLLKITEEGACFRSYINGDKHLLTPEKSIEIQKKLGADIVLVLDECTPFNVSRAYTEKSMHLSHRWAKRSKDTFDTINDGTQGLYGIVQGGIYHDLREVSADFVNCNDFFGCAIGGSLGSSQAQMCDIVSMTRQLIRNDYPVHLLGIGMVKDIFHGVACGIDTFDCVHPTRLARHGGALIQGHKGHLNLRNSSFKSDTKPIAENCDCYTCLTHHRGYLHHMLKAGELLAVTLISIHNIAFMNRLMYAIREAIRNGRLEDVRNEWVGS